jgi:guanosine-3',5'-bis(diphosphate) 3'-pyrophosphohydrolase
MLHKLNSDLETVMLNCAEAIAEYVHFGQKDKQGRPYIEHVARVAKACRNLTIEQRVAAILHDTLEDHADKVTAWAIEILFGSQVAELVAALSRSPVTSYGHYIEQVARYPLAIPIKLADLTDNLDPARGPIPDSLRERYEKASVLLLAAYVEACEKASPEERAILARAF